MQAYLLALPSVRPRTYSLWLPWRSFLVAGDPQPGIDLVKQHTKIYPLSAAAEPAPTLNFVDLSQKPFNTVGPADFRFWELLNQVVQGVTPAMEEKRVARGSQYSWTARDANGKSLDGGKNYKLRPPPRSIPVKDFWSVILYSNQPRSRIQTDQRLPSMSSQTEGPLVNPDGSVDVYFGPKAPTGKEQNWVQTLPGKGWNTILRLYGPLDPWFDKTWRPGEIELVP